MTTVTTRLLLARNQRGSGKRSVPSSRRNLVRIPDASRGMGLSLWAARGAGKSRTLGRFVAFQDFYRGVPLVILDPIGGTIDNFLDKISRRPLAERIELWRRVRYVNMNGQDGRVIPWPIYYQARESERFSAMSQRYVDVLARSDPDLARASIQGMNALAPVAQAVGIVLSALGLGITEASSLLEKPAAWEQQLAYVEETYPETAAAVEECRSLGRLRPSEQASRLTALESKLSLFRFAPNFRAIFGATTPGINWHEVVQKQQAVLIDFRDVESPQVKKFCLLWVYNSLLTFVKQRGQDRHTPISFIIDELSYLVGSTGVNADLLTADIDELINRIARSHSLWLTIAEQELFQIPEQIRQTVLAMGTVLLGQTSDYETAEELAKRYFTYDPYKVKKTEPIQGVIREGIPGGFGYRGIPAIHGTVGERTTEFTRDEQNYLQSRAFLNLEQFEFLLGQGLREGALPTYLEPITIARFDKGQYPEKAKIARLRSQLTERDGISEQAILVDIATRLGKQVNTTPGASIRRTATAPVQGEPTTSPLVRKRISRRSPKDVR